MNEKLTGKWRIATYCDTKLYRKNVELVAIEVEHSYTERDGFAHMCRYVVDWKFATPNDIIRLFEMGVNITQKETQ